MMILIQMEQESFSLNFTAIVKLASQTNICHADC